MTEFVNPPYYLEKFKDEYEFAIGKVEYFKFSTERCFTFHMGLELESGWHQSFGGIVLSEYNKEREKRMGSAFGCALLQDILEMFDIEDYNHTKGKIVYAMYKKPYKFNNSIEGIAHLGVNKVNNRKMYILLDELREDYGIND